MVLKARIEMADGSSVIKKEFETETDMFEWCISQSNPFTTTVTFEKDGTPLYVFGFLSKNGISCFRFNMSREQGLKSLKEFTDKSLALTR